MRIAVMGTGGVGGYYGSLLSRAGNEVIFIARGEHMQAIKKEGLTVNSHDFGRFNIVVKTTSNPADVGQVDLVIFAVKTYHNAETIPTLKPMVGPGTSILSLQNGIESYEQLAAELGGEQVLPGAAYIEAQIEAPGVISQTGEVVRIVFGEYDGKQTSRVETILQIFSEAGINAELSEDVMKAMWTKFVLIACLAGTTAASRVKMDRLLSFPEGRELVLAVLKETEAVGRARGIALDDDLFMRTVSYLDSYAKDLKASMHTDLERGRPLELEAINGAVIRLGKQLGVPTPMNLSIYALLKPYVNGAGG